MGYKLRLIGILFLTSLCIEGASPGFAYAEEKIQVTGSRIRQLDTEGATPLFTIDQEELEKSGSQSVGEVLQGLSSNSFGSRKESYGGQQSGSATVNLRGVGDARTLVLLNGRRVSGDPQTGAVDLNMIPIRAIEKVEVLNGGASAIYGSDALGGVVNIILKKGFSGNAVGSRGFQPTKPGAAGSNHYFLTGFDSERYSFLGLVQYRRNHALYNEDRTYFRDRRNNGGIPASYRGLNRSDGTDSAWQTSGCDPELLNDNGTDAKCLYWIDRQKTRQPDLDHLSMMTSLTYQVNPDTEFFAQFYASRKELFWYWFPTYDQRNIIVPAASVTDRLPEGADIGDASEVEIFTSMLELGRDERRISQQAMGVQAGLRGDIGDFTWEFGASTDQSFKTQKGSNQAYYDRLQAAITSGAFDPFAAAGQRVKDSAVFEGVRADAFLEQESTTAFYDLTFAGPLVSLPAGDVEVAFGVSLANYEYQETQDQALKQQNIWGTFGGSDGGGDRDVTSAFFEAQIPLAQNLTWTLAGRRDDYSDYGSSNTPATALRYAPTNWLAFRASGTRGFKAPTLYEVHRAPTLQYIYPFEDAVSGITKSMYITQAGNEDIEEETSMSYNFGMILAPFKGAKFSVDYWSLEIEDVIGYPDIEDVTEAEAAGEDVSSYGVTINRDPVTQEITQVTSTYMNIGEKKAAGFDFALAYGLYLDGARLNFHSRHSIMNRYEESGFPSQKPRDRIGQYQKPRIRNSTSLSYGQGGYSGTVNMQYIGAQPRDRSPRSEYKKYNLSLAKEFASQLKLSLGVKNLTDTMPPADDHYLYDLAGRTYWAGLEQIF